MPLADVRSQVQPWLAPTEHFEAMRTALRQRAALMPYLYTALRAQHDVGLGLMRPLYYDHPDEPTAYMQVQRTNSSQTSQALETSVCASR